MSADVQFLLFGLVAFCLTYIATEEQKKRKLARRDKDNLPGAGVSFLGLGSVLVILISLAHIIVRLLFGS